MKSSNTKRNSILVIILAWIIALALVYLVYTKLRLP